MTFALQKQRSNQLSYCGKLGQGRESNPGPLAPKARIIPLDQGAYVPGGTCCSACPSTHYKGDNEKHPDPMQDLVKKFVSHKRRSTN